MARKASTNKKTDEAVAKELEEALDIDLTGEDFVSDGDLDIAASMEDLEAQIAQAADDLAREGRAEEEKGTQTDPKPAIAGAAAPAAADLRPVEPAPKADAAFQPANDDRQRDSRANLQSLGRGPSRGIYWATLFLSLAWIAGGLMLGHILYAPGIWEIRTIEQLFAAPSVIGLGIGILVPLILFWGFAVMIRRAQEMRHAARTMTEAAMRLAEPENIAQDRIMTVGQAIRREVMAMGDGIERTLARAVELETLVHSEVTELERAYSDNEVRIRTLVDGLSGEREAVISHAERVRASISGAHETLKEEMDHASDTLRESIVSASGQLLKTVTESGDSLVDRINLSSSSIYEAIDQRLDVVSDRITTSGEVFASQLDTRIATLAQSADDLTGSLSEALDDRLTGMISMLNDATSSLTTEFDSRLAGVENILSERSQALIGEFETRAQALDSGAERLNSALEARARQINETLVERAREIATTFTDARQDIAAVINEGKAKIGTDMAELIMSTSSLLDERAQEFTARLMEGRGQVTATLEQDYAQLAERANHFSGVLAENREQISAALERDMAQLVERAGDLTGILAKNRDEVSSALERDMAQLAERAGQLTNVLAENRDKISSTLERDMAQLTERAGELTGILATNREKISATLEKDMAQLHERAGDLARILASNREQVSASLDKDIATLSEHTNRFAGMLSHSRQEVSAALEKDIGQLSERRADLDNAIAQHVMSLADRQKEIGDDVASNISRIEEAFGRQSGIIEERTRTMETALGAGVDNVRKALENSAGVVAGSLRDKVLEITSTISQQAERTFDDVDQRIIARTHQTSAELEERARQITESLADADKRIAGGTDSLVSRLNEGLTEAETRLTAGTNQIGEKLHEQVLQTEARLISRANSITETFADAGSDITERTDAATRTIAERTRELNEMLSARSADIAEILDKTARPLVERFAQSGGELQRNLENATQQATERLRAESVALVNALANRTAETLTAVEGAKTGLVEGVSDLIDRLSASNSKLGELIDMANVNLGAVDTKLADSTQGFASTAEKAAQSFASSARLIDTNASRLTELSSSTLKDVSSIATKFDEHGKLLASASNLLGSAQANLASTLDERQQALEELSVGLVKKSEDIERIMRNFETLIEGTIDRAEGRTRSSTEELRGMIADVVESASTRFSDATSELRRTAEVIRSELENTRAEIKRGVFELPEETRESTSAMRRAVSEQINALKELSDIVARSGRMLDASDNAEPAPRNPRPSQPQRAAQPARPAPELPRAERPAPEPARGGGDTATKRREPAAGQQPSGGWVSDLLRGASREDEPTAEAPAPRQSNGNRSPLHVVESLNSLSVDIARAIDHDAAIELWERYRRGERNVFTRRLYTLKGQQTFDEIRRKYQSDGDFRTAVDRYCVDFEKLLEDVSSNDRDNMMTQTYLSSDTGKVYTMLAHAAGRLR
jgi:phage-related protein